MRSLFFNRVRFFSSLAASLSLCCIFARPAFGQACPITFPASPGNDLTADITIYPNYNTSLALGAAQQLTSWFMVDVNSSVSGPTPPIPYGLYPTWCVDEWDAISPTYFTVPGSPFTGALYSTCDPNLNNELPAGHPNTLVSPAVWQQINYILNHQSGAFYWDVQAAINTLVGSGVGSLNSFTGTILTTPVPDGSYPDTTYPTYDQGVVNALLAAAAANAATWFPQCSDVYGVIYVTPQAAPFNQFILLEVPISPSSVSGYVYLECSSGQAPSSTATPLVGVTVELLNGSVVPESVTTDATGHYSFPAIPPGTYSLQVVPPANYSQTYPSSGPVPFTVAACGSETQNFGLADYTPPSVTCPPSITIATNFTPIFCTFSPSDWCSPCNEANTTPSWWVSWDQQNRGYNCSISWSQWYASCSGNNSAVNCWNFCQTQQSGNNSQGSWWGGSCNQNSAPSWCASYNYGNPNENWWVPCNGYNPGSVLGNCFSAIYSSGFVQVGLANGCSVKLTSPAAVRQCLGFSGTPGVLTASANNPTSCSAGSFCAQVLALQLNCDFGDAGAASGFGGPCGDLVFKDSTSPCNGWTVREILQTANCVLGGGSAPSGCTAGYLCGLCGNLNQCFEGCQVSSWCQSHLLPTYIPPPSVSGTATVTSGACNPAYVLTYCDSIAAGTCPCSYVITRTWEATAGSARSSCEQLITITPFPGPSISGTVVNDCAGIGCSTGGNYGNYGNNWGNNGGWGSGNSTPNFSGEAGLAGVTVTLKTSTGAVLDTTVTDTNGDFTFPNPGDGTYTVVVTPPAGYTLSYPTSGTANQASVTITSSCQIVGNLLFAYTGNKTAVQLVKTGPATAACGQTITYNFAVINTGNNCVAVAVTDKLLGGQIYSQSSLAPGQEITFTQTYTLQAANIGTLVNTASVVATSAVGSATSTSSATTDVTTKPVTCSITCAPNSISGSAYLWCNARLSASPNCAANLYCQNATITLNCSGGKSYTYTVPNSQICFSPGYTTGANYYNGTQWCSTVPSGGDTEIFLAGCGIAPNAAFASCQSITWTGTFTSDSPGFNFNWQFGSSC